MTCAIFQWQIRMIITQRSARTDYELTMAEQSQFQSLKYAREFLFSLLNLYVLVLLSFLFHFLTVSHFFLQIIKRVIETEKTTTKKWSSIAARKPDSTIPEGSCHRIIFGIQCI